MHLHFCFLLALTLPLTLAQDDNCVCEFTNQMYGFISLWVGRLGYVPSKFEDFFFQVDQKLQRAKIYHYGKPSYYMDYKNKTLYKFEATGSRVPDCKYSDLPDIFKLPACVPQGLQATYNINQRGHPRDSKFRRLDVYRYFQSDQTDGPYSFLTKDEGIIYKVIHGTNPCKATGILDAVQVNSTAARFYKIGVNGYKLSNPQRDLFPNTTACVAGNISLL